MGVALAETGEEGEWAYPQSRRGIATTNPAIGPATPMSSTAWRDGMGSGCG